MSRIGKEEFLSRLFDALGPIGSMEEERLRQYYTELVLDKVEEGYSEEKAVASLGEPEKIARTIQEELNDVRAELIDPSKTVANHTENPGREDDIYLDVEERQITSFDISAEQTRIYLKLSQDDRFRIHLQKEKDDEIEYYRDQNRFILRHKARKGWKKILFFGIGSFFGEQRLMTVELPKHMLEEGMVKTSNARIEADEIELSKRIHLQTNNGPIYVKNSRSECISANSTNSRIEVEKCVSTKIHCHTTNAGVSIKKCDNAEVKLSSTNGSIHAQECRLKSLYCGTTNGAIKVEEISADTIELSTTNGSVNGNIYGCEEEFSIDTNTTNGSNSLRSIERTNVYKRLCVHTTNGSIKIQFVS